MAECKFNFSKFLSEFFLNHAIVHSKNRETPAKVYTILYYVIINVFMYIQVNALYFLQQRLARVYE